MAAHLPFSSVQSGRRLLRRRGIATRFDKRAVSYRAAVVIVSLILWLA